MKKNAFTLAEALICLAIIGVVASLTIPSLANNIEKNKVGPAFAKAVNNIESANKMALYKWGARTLSEVAESVEGHTEASYFDVVLKPALNMEKFGKAKPAFVDYKKYNSSDGYSLANSAAGFYYGVDDIDYIRPNPTGLTSVKAEQFATLPQAYSGEYYLLLVDINGMRKKPNMIGKDLFLLYIDNKGEVIPYGGEAYEVYTGDTTNNWKTKCTKDEVKDAETCAGAIADNRYRVKYDY